MSFLVSFLRRALASAVLWSFAATALKLGGFVFLLPLALRNLPSSELGLWYVFQSLGGLAVLLDMGFFPTLSRAAGYAWAGATELLPKGISTQNTPALPNYPLLGSLIATMRWFYARLAIAITVLMGLLGSWWIARVTSDLPDRNYLLLAWILYTIGIAWNITGSLWPGLLTGINAVREGQKLQMLSTVINLILAVGGLLAGYGIFSLVAGKLAEGFCLRVGGRLYFKHRCNNPSVFQKSSKDNALLRRLWPMAWRAGVTSIGAYLIIYSNTLITSAFLGLDVTASYGLTQQLVLTLAGVSGIWVQVKLPAINLLRTQNNLIAVTTLFIQRIRLAWLSYALGAVILFMAGPQLLNFIHTKTLLLPASEFAALLIIIGLEFNHSLHAGLVLTENHNPFVVPALVSGIVITIAGLFFAPQFGIWGLLVAQGTVQLAFNNWWTCLRAIKGINITPYAYLRQLFSQRISI